MKNFRKKATREINLELLTAIRSQLMLTKPLKVSEILKSKYQIR